MRNAHTETDPLHEEVEKRTHQRLPLPVAFRRVPGSPLVPALTNKELHAILDNEELRQLERVCNCDGGTIETPIYQDVPYLREADDHSTQ